MTTFWGTFFLSAMGLFAIGYLIYETKFRFKIKDIPKYLISAIIPIYIGIHLEKWTGQNFTLYDWLYIIIGLAMVWFYIIFILRRFQSIFNFLWEERTSIAALGIFISIISISIFLSTIYLNEIILIMGLLVLISRGHDLFVSSQILISTPSAYKKSFQSAYTSSKPYALILRSFKDSSAYRTTTENIHKDLVNDSNKITESYQTNLFKDLLMFFTNNIKCVMLGSLNIELPRLFQYGDSLLVLDGDDSSWESNFNTLAENASLIVSVPGNTNGAIQELNFLTDDQFLSKTLFVMPSTQPTKISSIMTKLGRRREFKKIRNEGFQDSIWRLTRAACQEFGLILPVYRSEGGIFIMQNKSSPIFLSSLSIKNSSISAKLSDYLKEKSTMHKGSIAETIAKLNIYKPERVLTDNIIPGRSKSFANWFVPYFIFCGISFLLVLACLSILLLRWNEDSWYIMFALMVAYFWPRKSKSL